MIRVLYLLLFIAAIPILPCFWLSCRLTAERCPACGSKWRTELMGEWDGEDWKCHACGHCWGVKV